MRRLWQKSKLSRSIVSIISIILFCSTLFSRIAGASLEQTLIINSNGTITYSVLGPLHTEGRWIKNEQGNIIVLRGVASFELAYVGDPEYTSWYANNFHEIEAHYELLKQKGGNVVRLAINKAYWEKWRDTPFQGWNFGTYPEIVDNIVQWCKERNIYVMLQQHGLTYPHKELNAQVKWDFQTTNRQELINWFIELANRYKDEPTVCGIDIFNEPSGASHYPDKNTTEVLHTWYDFSVDSIQQIHQVAPNWLIFLQVPGFSLDSWLSCPDGLVTEPNVVYTAHAYYTSDLGYLSGLPWTTWNPHYYATLYNEGKFDEAKTEMENLYIERNFWILNQNYPVCINEFGTATCAPYWYVQIQDFYDMLEKYGVSWVQWGWHHCWTQTEEEEGPIIYNMLKYDWSDVNDIGQIYANYMANITSN